ncbi:ABC-F family ATP-binding cassette domain-containing protein [Reyranella sp.]|uniref:ABC-F family ATP-binding cassette domain-containing protein n=1 Tax=Reyranella sp. TaxID=1929291 RepID=UPI003BAD05BE
MSPSVILSGLAWSLPDGRPLFTDLTLGFEAERTGLVGRNGVGKSTLLALIAGRLRPHAGSVAIHGRLAVLRQLVQVADGETIADLFGARAALTVLRRAERGDAGIDELTGADWTLESRMASALARTGLAAEPDTKLARLSGGQRTRASLAALLFAEPDFVLLDEPTNNLDRDGRRAVLDLLAGWQAGALVASHDRELLETVDAIVELGPLGAMRHGGNWSVYRERRDLALAAARHDLETAERRVAAIEERAQATAERQARRAGAGRRQAARGGTPRILQGARRDRSEGTSGGQARLADRRRSQALADATDARARIEVLQPIAVTLAATGLPSGHTVLEFEGVSFAHTGGPPIIDGLSLSITGAERVAATGPNGSGKSTLLALAAGRLDPTAGSIRRVADVALLDQTMSLLDPAASILDNFRRLHPGSDENACRAALARLMFRADAALQAAGSLSGGQQVRAALACVLGGGRPPSLLMLDEPTNHLDLDALEAVEAGLRAYDGALLVVSHDEAFLEGIGITRRVAPTAAA